MLHRTVALAALALVAACVDRTPVTSPPSNEGPPPAASLATSSARPEGLARMVAKGLKNPAFRAYLKAQLDASPYREHKLQFETFLAANSGRALREVAFENSVTKENIAAEAKAAIALEVYLPVPAHRAAWQGDEHILVATALTDDDPPIAFDPEGHRQVLDPKIPPSTPVLAIVPVETDFSVPPQPARPAREQCLIDCGEGGGSGGGGSPPPPPPGLYMTKSHFVQDFEGWLKGSPEFEVHILGQKGTTDSLYDYQCAGEHAGGPYYFDQNDLDWSGSVLLFSEQQLAQYNAAHPSQNVRVFVVEDDDTACQIKTDAKRTERLFQVVDSIYNQLAAGNDSAAARAFKYARGGRSLWDALTSFIKTNDDVVGNAVEDQIVGSFYPGFNWFVKGDNNITNGWVNLVMY
ncbi:MAG TPA: hypothetical protein VEL50_07795 [Gemmatimonadales bacterium]|nr:hypothetical protein [Gemmatimonadales bacterium]